MSRGEGAREKRGRPPGEPGISWEGPEGGRVESGGRTRPFLALLGKGAAWVWLEGRTYRIDAGAGAGAGRAGGQTGAGEGLPAGRDLGGKGAERARESSPAAPIPGTVLRVGVKAGERVERGDLLVTISAMKMEHEVRSGVDGTVVEVHVAEGRRVEAGDPLVRIAPA